MPITLNVVIMGQNCEKFIGMCLESVKKADNIIYCDGGSDDFKMVRKIEEMRESGIIIIGNYYNQEDKEMNGKQRNFYLDYLKKNHMGEWVLVLDADEVVDNLGKIKEYVNLVTEDADDIIMSVKMRHFIGDLGHEDATVPEHFVPHRLFKIREELFYPLGEHPVLNCKGEGRSGKFYATTIWHLAYCPNMWDIKKRYDNHMKKSEMHTPQFLHQWYMAHLFGKYPKSEINPTDIPEPILKEFNIDRDEFYFANRNIEVKHFLMAGQYLDYLKMNSAEPKFNIIEFGCGKAPFGFAFKFLEADYKGVELSKFAVDHAFVPIEQGDILTWKSSRLYDMCLVFDVLEHLKYEDIDNALENIRYSADRFIFSIPFFGDPNLEADPTHIIKEKKCWWIDKLSKYFNIVETPSHWLYKDQIIIGEAK